jgi:hypothetical protein
MARVLFISVEEKNQSKLYDGTHKNILLSPFFFNHAAPNENWEFSKQSMLLSHHQQKNG